MCNMVGAGPSAGIPTDGFPTAEFAIPHSKSVRPRPSPPQPALPAGQEYRFAELPYSTPALPDLQSKRRRVRRSVCNADAVLTLAHVLAPHQAMIQPCGRGVLLNAAGSMTELVDTGLLHTLPGAVPSGQFLAYAIADHAGNPPVTSRGPRSPSSASTSSTSATSNHFAAF